MTHPIGGPMTTDALAAVHRPVHAAALADARDHLRRCLAAIVAADLPRAADAAELGILHSVLRDQLISLEQLQRRT